MPVIMILILGSMEATSAIFVRQALTTSAYEGIREAIRFTPADVQTAPRGSSVVVELRSATDAAAKTTAETLARTQDVNAAIARGKEIVRENKVANQGLQLKDAISMQTTVHSFGKCSRKSR